GGDPVRLAGGRQAVLSAGRLLGRGLETSLGLLDPFLQRCDLGSRIGRTGHGTDLGVQRREALAGGGTLVGQLPAPRLPLAEPLPRRGLLGRASLQRPLGRASLLLRFDVQPAAPGERYDLPFDPGLDHAAALGSAVAERAQDRVLASGHGGAELVVTCLQLGKALRSDQQLRLLPRERGFALPSERLRGGTLVPRILD